MRHRLRYTKRSLEISSRTGASAPMVEKEHTARACCGRLCDLHGRSGNGRRAGPRAILACDLLTKLVALPRTPPPLHAPYQTLMLRHILLSLAWESWCGSGRRTRPAEGAATDWAVARLPAGVRDHSRSAASPHAGCGRGDERGLFLSRSLPLPLPLPLPLLSSYWYTVPVAWASQQAWSTTEAHHPRPSK